MADFGCELLLRMVDVRVKLCIEVPLIGALTISISEEYNNGIF
jgi:hypothetical protein